MFLIILIYIDLFSGHLKSGAIDMKVTSYELSQEHGIIAICGPTFDNEDITPFVWSQADFGNSTNHFGHPDKFAFGPFQPKWYL